MGWKTQPVSGWGLFVVLTLVGPVFGVDNVLETSINIAREATCDYIHAKFPGCQSSNTKSSKTAECDYIHAQFQGCQPSDGADGKIRMKRKLAERVDESNQVNHVLSFLCFFMCHCCYSQHLNRALDNVIINFFLRRIQPVVMPRGSQV